MKFRSVVLLAVALFSPLFAADKKADDLRIWLTVEVERVKAEFLVVRVLGYAEEWKGGRLNFNKERADSWAVLVPGGKCASGDKFQVWAREAGIQKEAGYGNEPLRRYTVISAKRL